MFDKIGVQMHIVKAGDSKAAGEPFSRTSMSPEFRKNITEIYDDIYAQLLKDLANNYETTPTAFRNVIERGNRFLINQDHSKDLNIINDLVYFDQFLKIINTTEGKLIKYNRYNPTNKPSQYNRIAVVYAIGNITPNKPQFGENNINSNQFVRMLDKIEKDDRIKAVVIRINSGGGSALESEIIYNKIAQVKTKKPVVVSMGGVAASGGYYIAANANQIFADPYTITGSIGVISMIPDLKGTANKIGIKTEQVGHGKYLSAFNLWGMHSQDVEQAFQLVVNDIYHEFKTRVSESRNIDYRHLDTISQGKVWSAQRAKEHGLIDEIGSLNDAINKAAQIASISNYSLSYFPERKSFIEVIWEENLNIPMMKMALNNELPEIYNEIKNHPIQMRMEFELEN
jgi:protease-4